MIAKRSATFAAAIAAVAVFAGCDGSEVGSDVVDRAVDECLKEARGISDPSARRTAEESCRAAESGNAEGARDAARRQCLEAAREAPAGDARRRAEEACRRIR